MDKIVEIVNGIKSIELTTIIDIAIAIGIILFFNIFSGFLSYIIIKMFNFKIKDKNKLKKTPFYKPIKVFICLLGIYIAFVILKMPQDIMLWITRIFRIGTIMLFANGLANVFNKESEWLKKMQRRLKIASDDNRLNFVYKIIRGIIYIVAILIAIMELGYNINGIIAGFGVGGLIITLAAQDTAKNLFGGMVLIIDKPFIVGDWIEIKTFEGNVEDITFRSTRIRTFDNSIVNIPNAVLSNEYIVNWSKMEKRRYKLNLKLPKETSTSTIQKVTSKIYFMLINHPSVINDDTYVKFDEIKDDGINIMIYAFTNSVDYDSYLNAKEQINKNIIEILERENVKI